MENLTHSLTGATLAELTLPADATVAQRRIFVVTGVLAANLPDADLLYTGITSPEPLGYLLHHRGHTHTLGGIALLALMIGAVSLLPGVRAHLEGSRGRFWMLIVLGLGSHLVLDAWNSYGVHPFWQFDSTWWYGDAIFIAEPLFWVLLGGAAALSARNRRVGMLLGSAFTALIVGVTWSGLMPLAAFSALTATAAVFVALLRGSSPKRRAGVALVLSAAFVAVMFGLRERVRAKVAASPHPAARGTMIDVVLNPQPANPLCWSALAISVDQVAGEYWLSEGTTTSLTSRGCGGSQGGEVVWSEPVRQSLGSLGERYRADCRVRAWMEFGRVPELSATVIADARYGGIRGRNFTTMSLDQPDTRAACPRNVPGWRPPRSDLLRAALAAAAE